MKRTAYNLILAAALAAPLSALAYNAQPWLSIEQEANLKRWAASTYTKISEVVTSNAEMLMEKAKQQLEKAQMMLARGDTMVAAKTVQGAANEQLTQAGLNYRAEVKTNEAAAVAAESFDDPTDIERTCAVAKNGRDLASAVSEAKIAAKQAVDDKLKKDLYTESAGKAIKDMMAAHEEFCSETGEKRGQCKKRAVSVARYDADVNAGSLLMPSNGTTYSDWEERASSLFIEYVANSVPAENLAMANEKTTSGTGYVTQMMTLASRLSVVRNSLEYIRASFMSNSTDSDEEPPSQQELEEAGIQLSMMGLMKNFVAEHFESPQWKADLIKLDTVPLWKQVLMQMAGKNYFAFQRMLQAERMQAIVATQLSVLQEKYGAR